MSLQQYHCAKHPQYTRRTSHPNGIYGDDVLLWKGKIKYKTCIPKCPICREYMTPWFKQNKGLK